MKQFLQGSWLKHPLHPILVHVPTSLWPASLLFDILVALGIGGNAMYQAAFYSILFGLVAALAAIPAGIADWWDIKPEKPARRIGLYHMAINLAVTVLWALNLALRWGGLTTAVSAGLLPVLLSVVSVLALAVSGYLGGMMVYEYGISVGRHSKKKWRKTAELAGANVPSDRGGK